MKRTLLLLSLLAIAALRAVAGENHNDCIDTNTTTACFTPATITYTNIVMNPQAPSNAPYASIVCVCDTVTATLQYTVTPSMEVTTVSNSCTVENSTNNYSPLAITNLAQWNGGATNADSVAISSSSALSGSIEFSGVSAPMPTNSKCGGQAVFTNSPMSTNYAFVGVASLEASPAGTLVGGNPPTNAFCAVPTNSAYRFITVTATPAPAVDEACLPSCWGIAGGIPFTNTGGSISRTKVLVDCATPGMSVIVAHAGDLSWVTNVILVVQAQLKSLAFTNDHHVMTDYTNDWASGGSLYGKPDWVVNSSTNNPVSQTKNGNVTVNVTVQVQSAGVPFDLSSSGPSYLTFPTAHRTSSGGDDAIMLTSTNPLPNAVGTTGGSITWSIIPYTNTLGCAGTWSSGPHTIFVTWATPYGRDDWRNWGTPTDQPNQQVITYNRMNWACTNANGAGSENELAVAIRNGAAGQTAKTNGLSTPHPIWNALYDNYSDGVGVDCIRAAFLTISALELLGLPDVQAARAWATPTYDASQMWLTNCPGGHDLLLRYATVATNDSHFYLNNFEGCFSVTMSGVNSFYIVWPVGGPFPDPNGPYKVLDYLRNGNPGYTQWWSGTSANGVRWIDPDYLTSPVTLLPPQ